MKRFDVIIIGGGASGMFLASELAGRRVALIEANDRVGKKLLATGNGKCNLTNLDMNIVHYNRPSFVETYLDRFDAHDTIASFERMGLITKVIDKRVYPYSECASTVLDILRGAVQKCGTEVFTGHIVNSVEYFADTYTVGGVTKVDGQTKSFSFTADNVVLATGSNATFGRNSNNLFTALGHTNREFTPALVPIKTNKEPIKGLSGVRVKAGVRCGARYEVGEVLFKDFGVSGIAVFNMSSEIARGKLKIGSNLTIDFMPEYSVGEVENLLRKRGNVRVGELLTGTFHSKVVDRILWASGVNPDDLAQPKISAIARTIKTYTLKIEGLGDSSLSQVMSGGLNIREFDHNLMSMKSKNAFAIGEALDVDGDCGGYNLQWAWTSARVVAEYIRKQY
ncbi:MAG: aminoacetone oxidase family FAD-binding enzyme [Clostridia bacterium]|nr:aminoacetone oxidase family FAD-binding enzyme [Clostridia bacterium]